MVSASPATLNAMAALVPALTASTALLDTTNADLSVLRPATPINSLITPPAHASPAMPSAKLAQASNSVPLAPILKPSLSTVSAMIAHTHATLVAQLLPFAPPVSLDSTLLDLPVLLPAPLEPAPSTEFASALPAISTPTSAFLHAPLDTDPLEDSALNVLPTALLAQELPLPAPAASMDMPLTLLLVSARLPPTANSANTSLKLQTAALAFAPLALTTMSQSALLLVSKATKTTESEDVLL